MPAFSIGWCRELLYLQEAPGETDILKDITQFPFMILMEMHGQSAYYGVLQTW